MSAACFDFPLSFIDLPAHLALAMELLVQGQLILIDLPGGFLVYLYAVSWKCTTHILR
jgi:hypothetical protein